MGALVHVGVPASATLPPVPVMVAALESSVPSSDHEVRPAPVSEPVHAAGPDPSELGCSKDPFWILLPWTFTVRTPTLLPSLSSWTTCAESDVALMVWSPFTPRVSQPTETVDEPPAGIAGVATVPIGLDPSSTNSVVEAPASAIPTLAIVAVTVARRPSRAREATVTSVTTRSGTRG